MMKRLFVPSGLVHAAVLFLVVASPTFAATNSSIYVPRDYILLNCGSSSPTTDDDGRTWSGDTGSKYAPSLNSAGATALQDSSVPQVPYLSARVFTASFTYSFPLGAGRKFVRLYFYPFSYSGHAASDALFSVTAGNYTFLSNFSASQTATALNLAYIIREFSVNVSTSGLNLTFTPSITHANAYAFVNGIEVVSTPDLFTNGSSPSFVSTGAAVEFIIDPSSALQTMYRFNVGGQQISPSDDSGLYRSWDDDSPYIYGAGFGVTFAKDPNVTIQYPASIPNYIAPVQVYSTARSMGPDAQVNLNYNLTWILSVDAGFFYLVRLHFCEIQYPFTKINMRVFDIFLNNETAVKNVDVIEWSSGIGIPAYKDYVVPTEGTGQIDLWVALHPDILTKPQFYDAILNGLEVFKLHNNGSLAGLNPLPPPQQDVDPSKVLPKKNGKSKSNAPAIVGGVAGGFAIFLAGICIIVMCRRQKKKGKTTGSVDGPSGWLPLTLYGNSHSAGSAKANTTGSHASLLPANLCRHFSFAEIEAATKTLTNPFYLESVVKE